MAGRTTSWLAPVIVALASTASAGPAHRQSACVGAVVGTSSVALAFTAPVVAGSLLVVAVTIQGNTGVISSIISGGRFVPADHRFVDE